MSTFCLPYRGHPGLHGNFDTPASAMARGLAIVRSTATVAKAGAGVVPFGFLNSEVTTDGASYEELIYIPETMLYEKKVAVGKISVVVFQTGVEYIIKGNIKSGTTFAVGEKVLIAANGEFTDDAGASSTHIYLGEVQEIGVTWGGETGCMVWKAIADLGAKA